MSKVAHLPPKFPWDIIVPATPFWADVDDQISRAFVSCFTASELAALPLDPSLSPTEKLHQMQDIAVKTYEIKDRLLPGASLHTADWSTWRSLKVAIFEIDKALGVNEVDDEATALFLYNNGSGGQKDNTALGWLSVIHMQQKRYAEAETEAKEVLAWVSGLMGLGPDSPQALGNMRTLVESCWKQGKHDEAEEWIQKCRASIEKLGVGRFTKYQEEEREALERVIVGLE